MSGQHLFLCQEYECLSASYAKLLSVFMCAQREESRGVRVLSHCPGRDAADTAVLVIRWFYFFLKESDQQTRLRGRLSELTRTRNKHSHVRTRTETKWKMLMCI